MLALVVSVGLADVEVASDHLWSLGVVAIEERVATRPDVIELWTSLGDDVADVDNALTALGQGWAWRFEHVDEAVADTWRAHAVPTWVDDSLVICPAWRADSFAADVTALSIEPGATFGMGDHPTTILSLRAMRAVLSARDSVLDVGCGSGILAIAACMLGASAATAIDISPAAVPTTAANADRNGVTDRVSVSTTPLAQVVGDYRVVLANILAPALIEMAADLRRVMTADGALIISGILATNHEHVLEALAPLRQVAREDLDGWTAIKLRG